MEVAVERQHCSPLYISARAAHAEPEKDKAYPSQAKYLSAQRTL